MSQMPQVAKNARDYYRYRYRLVNLGFASYDDYLKSRLWLAAKIRYRASNRPQACLVCGDENFQLHHRTYQRIGRERLTDLDALCRRCHALVHLCLSERRPGWTLSNATTRLKIEGHPLLDPPTTTRLDDKTGQVFNVRILPPAKRPPGLWIEPPKQHKSRRPKPKKLRRA